MSKMNIGEAVGIFRNIDSESISAGRKLAAIDTVCKMETINGITKDSLLGALRYLSNGDFLLRCEDCKYFDERHYEKEGEAPYIKGKCKYKAGLSNDYRVNPRDYCSRGEPKEEKHE